MVPAKLEFPGIHANAAASVTGRAGWPISNALAAPEASPAQLIVQGVRIVLRQMGKTLTLQLSRQIGTGTGAGYIKP